MSKKRILFIINPFSGIGKQKKLESLISEKLDKMKFKSEIIYTEFAGHATEITEREKQNFDIIAIVGGDGSINEVAQKLVHSDTILGVIPAGSGNGFARHFGFPARPSKAIEVINQLKIKTIDTVKLNKKIFVNVAGLGYDAEMGFLFSKISNRGFRGYTKTIFNSFDKFKSEEFEFVLKGKLYHEKAFILSIANASQYGFNAAISPDSSVDDGRMNITVIEKFPLILAPLMAAKLFTGFITSSRYVKVYRAKKFKILNNKQLIAHLDGEPVILNKNLNFKILPSSLKIIVP
jgi:YegS/Rv2252/BmrU family lipid kinase